MGLCQSNETVVNEILIAGTPDVTHEELIIDKSIENDLIEMRLLGEEDFLNKADLDNDYMVDLICIGDKVISASRNSKITVYNSNLEKIHQFSQDGTCFCLSSYTTKSVTYLVSIESDFNRNQINIWNINEGIKVDNIDNVGANIWKIRILDNMLILCLGDGRIEIWDLSTKKINKQIKIHEGSITDALMQSPELLITGSKDGSIVLTNIESEQQMLKTTDKDWIYSLCQLNKSLFCAGIGVGEIRILRVEDFSVIQNFFSHSSQINSIVQIEGCYIVTSSNDRSNKIIRLTDGKILNEFNKEPSYEQDCEPICYLKSTRSIFHGDAHQIMKQGSN